MKTTKPLQWVPSLYLGESLPYAAVMLMSLVLYQEMGLTDTQITLYTGWLGLPWVIKPLWSPVVDGIKTKRWWILAMQLLIGASLALLAFTLPTSFWLQCSLVLHPRPHQQRPGTLCRPSQHLLSHRNGAGAGRSGHAGRPFAEERDEHSSVVEHHFSRRCWPDADAGGISLEGIAQARF